MILLFCTLFYHTGVFVLIAASRRIFGVTEGRKYVADWFKNLNTVRKRHHRKYTPKKCSESSSEGTMNSLNVSNTNGSSLENGNTNEVSFLNKFFHYIVLIKVEVLAVS